MSSIWRPSITPYDVLCHSAKGTTWKDHKYIKKEGDTYIYPKDSDEDVKKETDKFTIDPTITDGTAEYMKSYLKNGIDIGDGKKVSMDHIKSIQIERTHKKPGEYHIYIIDDTKNSYDIYLDNEQIARNKELEKVNEVHNSYVRRPTNRLNRLILRDKQFNKSLSKSLGKPVHR